MMPRELLLRWSDSAMVLGQRLAEQVGKAPMLEEEMANANVGLDLIGVAQQTYTLLAERGAADTADALVFQRNAEDFVNAVLVELPNRDFAHVVARQWLFDIWHLELLKQLTTCGDLEVQAIANKAVKESTYHLERSGDWVQRLADSTDEAKSRLENALSTMVPWCSELFEPIADERIDYDAIRQVWESELNSLINEFQLTVDTAAVFTKGGIAGVHTEYFTRLITDMQSVARAHPGAQW